MAVDGRFGGSGPTASSSASAAPWRSTRRGRPARLLGTCVPCSTDLGSTRDRPVTGPHIGRDRLTGCSSGTTWLDSPPPDTSLAPTTKIRAVSGNSRNGMTPKTVGTEIGEGRRTVGRPHAGEGHCILVGLVHRRCPAGASPCRLRHRGRRSGRNPAWSALRCPDPPPTAGAAPTPAAARACRARSLLGGGQPFSDSGR